MKRVVIERRERVYDGFFKLDETHLSYERFDGTMSEPVSRLALERGDSAAVLLYRPESRQIVLVNQFRYPTYEKGPGWIVETLAGVVDPGEDPEDAARREVLEESGYALRDLVHLSTFYVSPGGSSERIFLYLAEIAESDKVTEGGGRMIEGEDIVSVELSLADALAQVRSGVIADAKTIVAIYALQDRISA
jgi:nudix-type nucleoside diphosphatase (YffH/AdpP family)